MSWSLNEVEGLARKATRGAGLSWGLAEDTGRAVRWVCAMGLPGAIALSRILPEIEGADYSVIAPASLTGEWIAPGGTLCPLVAGACLSDMAAMVARDGAVLGRTAHPLLLYPYVAAASDMTGTPLALYYGDTVLTRFENVSYLDGTGADLGLAESVRVTPATETRGKPARRAWRGDIATETARILQDFAARIYAPETEDRRLAGAGAGLSDND